MDVKTYLRDLFTRSATNPGDMIRSCKAVLGSLPIVANALVSEAGKMVRVARGSTLGATDGETIFLADLPIPGERTDVDAFVQMLAFAYGLVHHEIGHINYTTFPIPEDVVRDPFLKDLCNIVEDVRQENCHIAHLPGARPYLDALNAAMQLTGHHGPVNVQMPPRAVLSTYLLYRLYADFRGDLTLLDLANQAEGIAKQMFPAGMLVRLETLLARVGSLGDSEDSAQLARDIRQLLKDELENAKQEAPQQPDAGESSGGTQSGSSQDAGEPPESQGGDNSGNGPSDSSNGTTPEASEGAGKEKEDAVPDAQQRTANLQSALDSKDPGGDRTEAAAQALAQITDRIGQQGAQGTVSMTGSHLAGGVDDGKSSMILAPAPYDMQEALSVTGSLRVKLTREMEAKADRDVVVGTKGRRLSGKHLARVGAGDGRIFRRVDDEVEVNTAVCIAVDVSGSMLGHPVELASQALFACVRALEGIDGVNVAATVFPGFNVVKPFGVKSRLAGERFSLEAHGGTPMAEGITMAQRMLYATPEPRKVLLVVTDGCPNDAAATELAILAAESRGVEVYGLGIMTDAGTDLFPHWQSIQQISDLPFTMIGLLRERLLAKAA